MLDKITVMRALESLLGTPDFSVSFPADDISVSTGVVERNDARTKLSGVQGFEAAYADHSSKNNVHAHVLMIEKAHSDAFADITDGYSAEDQQLWEAEKQAAQAQLSGALSATNLPLEHQGAADLLDELSSLDGETRDECALSIMRKANNYMRIGGKLSTIKRRGIAGVRSASTEAGIAEASSLAVSQIRDVVAFVKSQG